MLQEAKNAISDLRGFMGMPDTDKNDPAVKEKMKNEFKKRFNLDHLIESEIIEEVRRINMKNSTLSKGQRDACITYMLLFLRQPNPEVEVIKDEDVNLGEPLTADDLNDLVQDTTVTEEVTEL